MVIRFKKYKYGKDHGSAGEIYAIKITEENLDELVAHMAKHGARVFVTEGRDGKPRRLRIKQRNFGENWGKIDWRVAKVGDYILRLEYTTREFRALFGKDEYWRVRKDEFETGAIAIKKSSGRR